MFTNIQAVHFSFQVHPFSLFTNPFKWYWKMKLAYYPPKQCVFIFYFIFCFHGGKFLGSPKGRLFHCYMRFLWAIWLHSRWPNPLEFPSSERLSTSVASAVLWNSLSKASYLWISQQDSGKHSDSWFARQWSPGKLNESPYIESKLRFVSIFHIFHTL